MVGQLGHPRMFEQESTEPNPRLFVSAKNSTEATRSSKSRAKAKIDMSTGAWKIAPLGGLVIRTIGGRFDVEPSRTLTRTGSETVETPLVSVALAVRL